MKLHVYPEELLANPTKEVTEFDENLKTEIAQVRAVMNKLGGCGMAANQLGIDKSFFVTPTKTFVNPELIEYNGQIKSKEGCLSFPTIQVTVKRHKQVIVRYVDADGKKQFESLEGFDAVVFQHEYDHLQGKTFLDHIGPVKRDIVLRKLNKWKKKNL